MIDPRSLAGRVLLGDNVELLELWNENSIDAIVTDGPYGLGFMGKSWDVFAPETVARQLRRDTRSTIRREMGWEDAPSPAMAAARYDLSAASNRRFQDWTQRWAEALLRVAKPGAHLAAFGGTRTAHRLAAGIEDAGWEIRDALMWLHGSGYPKSLNLPEGRGTALKPAWEPIILARKPLDGLVGENVAAYGTGTLEIDACRIPADRKGGYNGHEVRQLDGDRTPDDRAALAVRAGDPNDGKGRWPANVVLDEEAAQLLDAQSGVLRSGKVTKVYEPRMATSAALGDKLRKLDPSMVFSDAGGASRFYYCAKASKSERTCGGLVENPHPTVKPLSLMRWLVKLVTPPGGIVLDLFSGSGTTLVACELEGRPFVGIDKVPEYVRTAQQRVAATRAGWRP